MTALVVVVVDDWMGDMVRGSGSMVASASRRREAAGDDDDGNTKEYEEDAGRWARLRRISVMFTEQSLRRGLRRNMKNANHEHRLSSSKLTPVQLNFVRFILRG